MLKNSGVILLVALLIGYTDAVIANENTARLEALTKQVIELSAQVEELKSVVELLNAIRPDVATLMPDIAERTHVMHYAGDAGDWAVASHELAAIERLVEIIEKIDPEKGAMTHGFLEKNFEMLDEAIDHGEQDEFWESIVDLVKNCNACHVAAGSPAMKISLDVEDTLSLRHSHDLGKSKGMGGGHMHWRVFDPGSSGLLTWEKNPGEMRKALSRETPEIVFEHEKLESFNKSLRLR